MTTGLTINYTRPILYPKQEAAVFSPKRIAVVEASTKSGKTVACLVWLFEQALQGKPGWNYWWTAPIYSQAKIAYTRLRHFLPADVLQACKWNESDLRVTLPTGQVMWFKGTENPDSLYGEDVHACVIDEATRVREESWHAIRTTLTATEGPIRIIGNVKGRKNWAYKLARRAQADEPGMAYAKLTAFDAVAAGILSREEVMDAQRVLPPEIFKELYMAEPSDDAGNPFGMEAIAACVGPLSDARPAVWGWDLAKSLDWTVGIALDTQGHVCRFHRFQAPWLETEQRIIQETQTAPALVDATGVGDAVVESLQRSGLYRFEGFKFSALSKQELMFNLRKGIQGKQLTFPEGPIRMELESYEYVYSRTGVTYSASEGLHDDCVVALGLAWKHYGDKRISMNGRERKPVYAARGW